MIKQHTPFILLALLGLSIGVNILQGIRLNAARETLNEESYRGALQKGAVIPAFNLENLDGTRELVNYSSSKQATILYIFQPSCHFCELNSSAVRYLAEHTRGKYRIVGISLTKTGLSEFVREHLVSSVLWPFF